MKRLASFLLIFIVVGGMTPAANQDWKRWSERKARKVVNNATRIEGFGGLGQMLLRGIGGGLTGRMEIPQVQVTWITDDTCWALARIRQIQERLTDEEAVQAHDQCRSEFADYYAFYVAASEIVFTRFYGWHGGVKEDVTDTSNPNRIFLQHKKDRDIFLRPAKIVQEPSWLTDPKYLTQFPSVTAQAIILFPRDKDFLENQKEVEFEMVQEGDKIRAKFEIKKLTEDLDDL